MLEPREEVKWFAEQMEAKLKENDHKTGWTNCVDGYLLSNLQAKAEKLKIALGYYCSHCSTHHGSKGVEEIIKQSVNIANYAMMIADNAWNRRGKKC